MLRNLTVFRKNVFLQGNSFVRPCHIKTRHTRGRLSKINPVLQIIQGRLQDNPKISINLEYRRYKEMNLSPVPTDNPSCFHLVDFLSLKNQLNVDQVTEELLDACNYNPSNYIYHHLRVLGCPTMIHNTFVELSYTRSSVNWLCTYGLTWPEHVYFKGCGHSKKDASWNACLACVAWLKSNYPYPHVIKDGFDHYIEPFRPVSNTGNKRFTVNKQFFKNLMISTLDGNKRTFSTQAGNAGTTRRDNAEGFNEVQAVDDKKLDIDKITETRSNISKMFPHPKNALNNVYDMVAKEFNRKELRLNPQYKLIVKKGSNSWNCTYNLKWPEVASFTGSALTKQEASRKAALNALVWLKNMNHVNTEGQPIVFDETAVRELRRSRLITLNINNQVIDKMNDIINEYNTKMLDFIRQTKGNQSEEDDRNSIVVDPEAMRFENIEPKFLGLQTYVAKEPTKLPISQFKDDFIQLLRDNRVLVLKGEPGCGKSTRVPQYVLEHWAKEASGSGSFCRIAVTQPRRIAAISLADRVSYERGESTGNVVGYHVRLNSKFSQHTGRILYCTTGILLRHIQSDPALKSFSHVLLDEAHERDVNTDLLMNLLKKAMELNPDLKVIIMSATIDTNIFCDYFNGAPVMHIPGFTHSVKSYFIDSCQELNLSKTVKMCESSVPSVVPEDVVEVIKFIHRNKKEGAILCFLPGWDDISRVRDLIPPSGNMYVLCLHSRLQDSDQFKIFSRAPPGVRKVILATNIAETSVTIDDVVYVIDAGIHKESRFDVDKGVMCLDNHWISKASMIQRKGRAGRVQPGECFHLYTKAIAEMFDDYTLPEIMKTSLTKIVLDSKVYSNNMNAHQFMNQLLTPPTEISVRKAVNELKELELLDENENFTPLGRALADFQLEPKLAKAMVISVIFKCVSPIVDIATLFSSETEFFTAGLVNKSNVKMVKRKFCLSSDHLALMRMYEKWVELSRDSDSYAVKYFCDETGLASHKMATLQKLRKIHSDYLYNGLYDVLPISDKYSDNDELVKAVILCGVGNFLQHRNWDLVKGRYKAANVFLTKTEQKATITPESVNSKRTKFPSEFLIYINETRSNIRRTMVVRECSLISPLALLLFSNKDIIVLQARDESDPNLVQLSLVGTNLSMLCDREQAKTLIRCKESVFAAYKFYTLLLTQGGDYSPKINESWDNILVSLNDILLKERV